MFNRDFHEINHPFWGVSLFLERRKDPDDGLGFSLEKVFFLKSQFFLEGETYYTYISFLEGESFLMIDFHKKLFV